ncbi:MAG: histidine kinase dimerization/phospho-acceptor domain-containing protein [Eubacteriales bacterium]
MFSELDDVDKTSRITWVDVDGTVLFDSIANAEEMENHIDRPEISDALKAGAGEAVHFSKTLDTQTFYRAVRLKDGTVVRVSTTIDSVYKSVLGFIPYMILISIPVILLCMTVANLLTKKIIVPLNDLNLDNPLKNDVYDELSPLLLRMAKQNEQIKKQFEKLREKQQEFNAITENIREGLIILNDKGQVLSINKSAAGIFDVEPDDSINRHIFILNRSLPLQRAIESAMKGNPHEDKFIKGDKTYNLLASPVKGQDPVKGIILFLLDITEKQNAENIRREFSANVSHELKTPLTTILGYAELLKNNMVKPETFQHHRSISIMKQSILSALLMI